MQVWPATVAAAGPRRTRHQHSALLAQLRRRATAPLGRLSRCAREPEQAPKHRRARASRAAQRHQARELCRRLDAGVGRRYGNRVRIRVFSPMLDFARAAAHSELAQARQARRELGEEARGRARVAADPNPIFSTPPGDRRCTSLPCVPRWAPQSPGICCWPVAPASAGGTRNSPRRRQAAQVRGHSGIGRVVGEPGEQLASARRPGGWDACTRRITASGNTLMLITHKYIHENTCTYVYVMI